MRKIGLALFSVFLCICFAGCHADIADVPPLQLLGEGAPVYTVVRSDTANEKELAAVSLLRKYMENAVSEPAFRQTGKRIPFLSMKL